MSKKFTTQAILYVCLMNALVYSLNAIYAVVLPIHLNETYGTVTAGYLLSVNPIIMCFAPLFWGKVSDRSRCKNYVLLAAVVVAAAFYIAIGASSAVWWACIAIALYSFAQTAFGPLIDMPSMEIAKEGNLNYGMFRVMGTIGYSIVGQIIAIRPAMGLSCVAFLILAVSSCFFIMTMPKVVSENTAEERKKGEPIRQFITKPMILLFLMMGTSQFVWAYYLNFFPTYLINNLGGEQWIVGTFTAFTALSELPFFLMFSKCFKKFSLKAIVLVSVVATMVRCFAFSVVTSIWWLFAIGVVTGLFITILTYCVTVYVSYTVSPLSVGTVQTASYAFAMGVPRILAGSVGGYMTEYLGFKASCGVCCAIMAVSLIIVLINSKTLKEASEKIR